MGRTACAHVTAIGASRGTGRLACVLLALLLCVAMSGAVPSAVASASEAPVSSEPGKSRIAEIWQAAVAWIRDGYDRAPAVVLGLVALLVLPPLALFGVLSGWRHRHHQRAAFLREMTRPERASEAAEVAPAAPGKAWLEIEGRSPFALKRGLVRIGRHEENDIRLDELSVHRFHAVVTWSDDEAYLITDVGGSDGNGVNVNGTRVTHARLKGGDEIELGKVRLRFGAAQA